MLYNNAKLYALKSHFGSWERWNSFPHFQAKTRFTLSKNSYERRICKIHKMQNIEKIHLHHFQYVSCRGCI